MMKILTTALTTAAILAAASTPALANIYTNGRMLSGSNVFSFKNAPDGGHVIRYTAKLGDSLRITGTGFGDIRYGTITGTFTERHSNGRSCTGTFTSREHVNADIPTQTVKFFITGGSGCSQIGETASVEVTNAAGTMFHRSAVFHDPGNDPLEQLNIRSHPNGNLLGYALSGDFAEVMAREGDWLLVSTGGLQGWVHESLLLTNSSVPAHR